jgi:hypothetical protein
MKVKFDKSGLGQSKWYEYVVRFAFGGTVTALAGLIAKRFGPEAGGLFLAFPAIFPAAATLIEKHEKQKKEDAGLRGTVRGRKAAGVDAAGAWMGSLGLLVFAALVWKELAQWGTAWVLVAATTAWFATAVSVWQVREKLWRQWTQRAIAARSVRTSVRP